MSIKGKNAVITGSTSGIGLGIAQTLAQHGANIMLNGFGDADEIESIRASLETDHGVKAFYNGADLSKSEPPRELIADAAEKLGSVDILINNAGIQHVAKIEDFPTAKWDAIMAINLSSAFHTIAAAKPLMQKSGWGRIINIASAHGLVASEGKAAYVAAKHGIIGLSKVVALEVADQSKGANITCNSICPGWVLTPLVQKQVDAIAEKEGISVDDAKVKLLSEKQPAKRFIAPEEIGEMVAWISSDSARLVNGASLSIDGGWTAK